jgi:uncharacterized protein (TIGR00730 family)
MDGNFSPLSDEEIIADEENDIALIQEEFRRGFDFIRQHGNSVTFFGSARFDENNEHCVAARQLASRIVAELGYAIVTGGGPGIMEAANRGAFEAGGNSIGITIKLAHEQVLNQYVKDAIDFTYFFVRKTMLTFAAEAFIFFPGGFGTLDEFFDILTLVQTAKIPRVPIILVGSDYWKPLNAFIQDQLAARHKTIDENEMSLYLITDSDSEIIDTIKKTPVQNWWKEFEIIRPAPMLPPKHI